MTIIDKYVFFYGDDFLSNFTHSPITIINDFSHHNLFSHEPEKITFQTGEAFFQSRKAVFVGDKKNYYKIINAKSPSETKRIARTIKLDPNKWDLVRDDMMEKVIKEKFEQNPELKSQLMSPEFDDKIFVEASPWDKYWGIGMGEFELESLYEVEGKIPNFKGKNKLGEIITEYRNSQKHI